MSDQLNDYDDPWLRVATDALIARRILEYQKQCEQDMRAGRRVVLPPVFLIRAQEASDFLRQLENT